MTTSGGDSGGELVRRVAKEIRYLRKGRGLQAGDLDSRLGPLLLELADDGDPAAHRTALITEINRLSSDLPEEFLLCIRTSLALSAETVNAPNFTTRVDWLADQIDREYRTALRRINGAELRLAELIASDLQQRRTQDPVAPEGWYLRELKTVFRLDGDMMESEEDRHIVATRENLTEVMAWMDFPRDADQPGADLRASVRYGGRLTGRKQPSRNHFRFMVQLPAPLQPGDEHRFGLLLRMPRHMLRLPHYLVVPERRCERFNLTVRFDPQRLPGWIRRVDGETVRKFEDLQPAGELLVPDDTGEVRAVFSNLSLYLGYGIQWEPAEWEPNAL